jgi:hypothetical protein
MKFDIYRLCVWDLVPHTEMSHQPKWCQHIYTHIRSSEWWRNRNSSMSYICSQQCIYMAESQAIVRQLARIAIFAGRTIHCFTSPPSFFLFVRLDFILKNNSRCTLPPRTPARYNNYYLCKYVYGVVGKAITLSVPTVDGVVNYLKNWLCASWFASRWSAKTCFVKSAVPKPF